MFTDIRQLVIQPHNSCDTANMDTILADSQYKGRNALKQTKYTPVCINDA